MVVDILHIGDGDLNGDGKLKMVDGLSIYPNMSILGEISNLLTEQWPFTKRVVVGQATSLWQ